ncbi:MAG: universal stress protein [Anaerolineae bacterium]
MYTKILFPTDGSPHSERTLAYVKDLAQKFDAEVVVFSAYHYIPEYVSSSDAERMLQGARASSQAIVDGMAQELRAAEVEVKTMVDEGPAAKEILSVANTEGCDLIVLGAKGAGGITDVLLGSVSLRVLTAAAVPVLVVY